MIENATTTEAQPQAEADERVEAVEMWGGLSRFGGQQTITLASTGGRDGHATRMLLRPEGVEVHYQPPGSRPAFTAIVPWAAIRVVVLGSTP